MDFPKKSLGQNYLVDLNIVKKIVGLTEFKGKDVIEIGPGKGALTEELLKEKPKSLFLIEKDNLLSEKLEIKFKDEKKIRVFNNDILKFKLENIVKKNSLIVGNLPYNISSQILVKLLKFMKWPPNYSGLIFMFQKELAEKITGRFGTTKYGRLSILSNYRLDLINQFNISPNCFFPKPKVTSTVLFLKPKKTKFKIKKIENLEKITNFIFSSKRKMINKSIKKIFKNKVDLEKKINLNLNSRPAEIKPEIYYKITQIFEKI